MSQRGFSVDLNSDLGESYGAYRIGFDTELFPLISSANVACGFHGGDPITIERTVNAALANGVAIGAHPGFPDLVGFGRRQLHVSFDEMRTDTIFQLGALEAFCRVASTRLQHVKPHGALNNMAATDRELAEAIVAGIIAFDPGLALFAMPGSALLKAGEEAGLPIVREAFADRAYNPDGSLVSRKLPGAMVTDPEVAAKRMVQLVTQGTIAAINGKIIELQVQSICTHSDTPTAVGIVSAVRERLEAAGVTIQAPDLPYSSGG